MVSRNDFIEEKRVALDWFTPRPMPEGKYTLFYGVGDQASKCPINNTNGKYNYVCVPGFFSLIKNDGVPTITVSGPYILNREEK